jgi:peptidyl-prolyl cis-trans isomerase B (cyclophilin B)
VEVAQDAHIPDSLDDFLARALTDPSPLVRWTARKVAKASAPKLKIDVVDPHPNDWRGLPRPKAPILGLDLTKGDEWLNEEEILRLAETVRRKDAGVVLTMDFGSITTELAPYAEACPVHVANFVLCAAAGVYDGTTWHRVVPAFVIQGGDPHGDGNGDAGYSVPDEITTTRFERGILGMPKGEMRDTGGCQLFFMHCAAPHLDGGYTAYGKAIDGLDVIDKVRVGDVIRSAKVVELDAATRAKFGVVEAK